MTVGQKIKELRLSRGLTKKQLADEILFTDGAVSRWEGERTEPSMYALVALADYFNITLDELCYREVRK